MNWEETTIEEGRMLFYNHPTLELFFFTTAEGINFIKKKKN